MKRKRKSTGFTMVELLAVLGIIALLVGLLLPALSAVRNIAKETKQKAQFSSVELALTAFKNDYGDYPPSNCWIYETDPLRPRGGPLDYCGAQKLAEALLGWDLLGFHPETAWDAAGSVYSDPDLGKRKGPYLDLATTNVFRLGNSAVGPGLYNNMAIPGRSSLAGSGFVICDVFGIKKMTYLRGMDTVTQRAGTPILYYKANTSSRSLRETTPLAGDGIYDYRDNDLLVALRSLADADRGMIWDARRAHYIEDPDFFYEYIRDPRIDARAWPYRPDSYILISAGADGLYGTGDDVCNFGN